MTLLLLGLLMTTFCLALQIGTVHVAQYYFDKARQRAPHYRRRHGLLRTSIVMVMLMIGIVLQMLAWAGLYRRLGLFSSGEEALYFSGVTFTSLGYGDVIIREHFRFLAPMEAATGLMMFAIVTAVLIGIIQQEAKAPK